jgi:hypothetical protein
MANIEKNKIKTKKKQKKGKQKIKEKILNKNRYLGFRTTQHIPIE